MASASALADGGAVLLVVGQARGCLVIRVSKVLHTMRWAPYDLWVKVAHVDPLEPNPTVNEYNRCSARRPSVKRVDVKRFCG